VGKAKPIQKIVDTKTARDLKRKGKSSSKGLPRQVVVLREHETIVKCRK